MNLVFISGLLLTVNAFALKAVEVPKTGSVEPQKKVQKMKVLVKQDGKEISIDTTFNLTSEKAVQAKIDSILKVQGIEGITIMESADDSKQGPHVIIMKDGKGTMTGHFKHGASAGNENFNVFYMKDDSGQVKSKKIVRIGKQGGVAVFDTDGDLVPPPPPPPPFATPHVVQGFRLSGNDPFALDPDDADVVTYDKKDIGKGLEKITIVRKKRQTAASPEKMDVRVEVIDDQKK